jgi:hypothetical protein
MKAFAGAVIIYAACGTSGSTNTGVDASCTGTPPICCNACLSDVHRPAVCEVGEWRCPSGTFTQIDCIGECTGSGPFCSYLPTPQCASCADGTMSGRYCNGGHLICPSGSYDTTVEDAGVCASDASAD